MKRRAVAKGRSVSQFRSRAAKTHVKNVKYGLRGGIRL